MEVYQWLFRSDGFKVSRTGYFVFANAGKNRPKFDAKLEFVLTIIPYEGETGWIEPTLSEIRQVLDSDQLPASSTICEYCRYREMAERAVL